jgi:chemotaxis response regulator CheB
MNIGIVNDLPLAVEALRRAIARRPEHRVLWVATDGAQAIDFCAAQPPDVVLMDLIMPRFDGVEATRRIMASGNPCAILVVTSSVGANAWRVYEAMGAGALDAVDTPTLGDGDGGALPLLTKIDQIGRLLEKPAVPKPAVGTPQRNGAAPLVAIGASAGGPTALANLLGKLPADFGAGIAVVQHVDQAFAAGMAEWLDGQSALKVRVARRGAAGRHQRPYARAGRRQLRLHARARVDAVPSIGRRVLPQRGRALAGQRDWRAADGHGARWCDRPEGDARQGLSHHRPG